MSDIRFYTDVLISWTTSVNHGRDTVRRPAVRGFGIPDIVTRTLCHCVQGWKGFQFVHLVRPTDIFYSHIWTNPNLTLGGAWMPSYWVRSRFEPADAVATVFKFGLMVWLLHYPDQLLH